MKRLTEPFVSFLDCRFLSSLGSNYQTCLKLFLALSTLSTILCHFSRFQQIGKNICLLVTAILHFVHTTVQPVLMSISASRSNNRSSHIRVILTCDWSILVT